MDHWVPAIWIPWEDEFLVVEVLGGVEGDIIVVYMEGVFDHLCVLLWRVSSINYTFSIRIDLILVSFLGCRELLRLQRHVKLMARAIIMALGVWAKWRLENNNACGVDIAAISYDSKAAGIRILGGPITTTDEATALTMVTTRLAFIAAAAERETTVRL